MTDSTKNFLDSLYQAHIDNAQMVYFGKGARDERSHSVMPATSFIFEFFIYNSLYQHDWKNSLASGNLVSWPRGEEGYTESKMQQEMERFIKKKCLSDMQLLMESFSPLAAMGRIEGDWAIINSTNPERCDEGKKFFDGINSLNDLIMGDQLDSRISVGTTFDIIKECRRFVYSVRNNIFHGSKRIAEIYDVNQRRRIEVYELFLRCLISLFFRCTGRNKQVETYIFPPLNIYFGNKQCLYLSPSDQIELVSSELMRIADAWLISRAIRYLPSQSGFDNLALFYPSARLDLITPLLIGLPHCSSFYFYEIHRPQLNLIGHPKGAIAIEKALKALFGCSVQKIINHDEVVFQFDALGQPRSLHWIFSDNMEFLSRPVPLGFYFHRGDSEGEGGSGQKWDSELFPELMNKVPDRYALPVVTQGRPGGVSKSIIEFLEPFEFGQTKAKENDFTKQYLIGKVEKCK